MAKCDKTGKFLTFRDANHILYITTKDANYDIWADFLTFRSSSLDEQFLGRGAGGGEESLPNVYQLIVVHSYHPYVAD